MTNQRANLLRVLCPHCRAQATTRTSNSVTVLHREIIYQCSNVACGHSFKALLEIRETICPSQIPDPDIHLPIRPLLARRAAERAIGRPLAANDAYGHPANDDTIGHRQSG